MELSGTIPGFRFIRKRNTAPFEGRRVRIGQISNRFMRAYMPFGGGGGISSMDAVCGIMM